MKASILFLLTAIAAALPAQAQMRDREPRSQRFPDERPLQVLPAPPQPREFRRDEYPLPGQLTPEERRQLRRDIRNAGQDLYPRRSGYRYF